MKITSVRANNRKRQFEIEAGKRLYIFPYARLSLIPDVANRIAKVYVDKELAREAISYVLESGDEDSVHLEQILEFNEDPTHMTESLIYRLTLLLQSKLTKSAITKRQLAKLLQTSPPQLERLLDQTNYSKSIRQLIQALHLLDCRIEFVELDEKSAA